MTPGNIDLNNRPTVQNADGSYSTVRTITIDMDGQTVLLPTVINGKIVSNDEAIQYYKQTGQNLGKFNSQAEADAYDEKMHTQQGWTGPQNKWTQQSSTAYSKVTPNMPLNPLFQNSNQLQQSQQMTPQVLASLVAQQAQANPGFTPTALQAAQSAAQQQGQPQINQQAYNGNTPMLQMQQNQIPQINPQSIQLQQPQMQRPQGQGMMPPARPIGQPQQQAALGATPAQTGSPQAAAVPAQQPVNPLAGDKITTALHDALISPESNPMIKTLKNAGVDMDTAVSQLSDQRDAISSRPMNSQFVAQQGQQDAVKTAFNGGSYMDIASSMIGKSEGPDHAVISAFVKKNMGTNIDPRQTPWCAAYVNSVLQAGGIQGSGSLAARSLLNVGTPIDPGKATKGDVIVFGRGGASSGKGHVGFVDHISADGKTVYVLGGNQGSDGSVSISARPLSSALGIRRPTAEDVQAHVNSHPMMQAGADTAPIGSAGQGMPNTPTPQRNTGARDVPMALSQAVNPAPIGNAYNRQVPVSSLHPDDVNTLMQSAGPDMAPLINTNTG